MTDDEINAVLFKLLQTVIPPAPEWTVDDKLTAETLRAAVAAEHPYERPTWVVPPGFTVDWSIPVDVVESPWPSDYVYVLPPQRDPWS